MNIRVRETALPDKSQLFFGGKKLAVNAGSLKNGERRIAVGFESMRSTAIRMALFPCNPIIATPLAGDSPGAGCFVV
jgi:hypothetical protein